MGVVDSVQAAVRQWLEGDYDESTKHEIRRLQKEDPEALKEAFCARLRFGTGGIRGLMGVGPNRLNRYTIRAITQGLANHLKQKWGANASVFIGYDSRHHSKEFAEDTARVLLGNQIRVFLCRALRPTPFVSFGVRYHGASSGVMITASHNPPQYNGYKVYNSVGGQLVSPDDEAVLRAVGEVLDGQAQITLGSLEDPLLTWVGEHTDRAYLDDLLEARSLFETEHASQRSLQIVYTSLHGTGITLLPTLFADWGFPPLHCVPSQVIPDGDFPNAPYPNPEEMSALQGGIALLEQLRAQVLLATDPDADRLGVAVLHQDRAVVLTGNQIAMIAFDFLCRSLVAKGRLPSNGVCLKSFATTEMLSRIAEHYGVECESVPIGFKYIAARIAEWDTHHEREFIFGAEESCGYLFRSSVRDKDAIQASILLAECAEEAHRDGITLLERLNELYCTFGVYYEAHKTIIFQDTSEGHARMGEMMKRLRADPPEFAYTRETVLEDYSVGKVMSISDKREQFKQLPKVEMLIYRCARAKVIVRPSGTEPKVKVYCEVWGPIGESVEQVRGLLQADANDLIEQITKKLKA